MKNSKHSSKFIIQDDTLIIGIANNYKELQKSNNLVTGGGLFEIEIYNVGYQNLILWIDSNFEQCTKNDVQKCIDAGRVTGVELKRFMNIKINV